MTAVTVVHNFFFCKRSMPFQRTVHSHSFYCVYIANGIHCCWKWHPLLKNSIDLLQKGNEHRHCDSNDNDIDNALSDVCTKF